MIRRPLAWPGNSGRCDVVPRNAELARATATIAITAVGELFTSVGDSRWHERCIWSGHAHHDR
jgi:hypothetical protein